MSKEVKEEFKQEVYNSIKRLDYLTKTLRTQSLIFKRRYEAMKCGDIVSNELIPFTRLISETTTNLQAELYFLWKVEDKAYG